MFVVGTHGQRTLQAPQTMQWAIRQRDTTAARPPPTSGTTTTTGKATARVESVKAMKSGRIKGTCHIGDGE